MKDESVRYFLGANSNEGFYSLYSGLTDPGRGEQLRMIKAGPGGGKSGFLRRIGEAMEQGGARVEYIHCSGDPDSLDGIRMPDFGIAYVDGTAPHAAATQGPIGGGKQLTAYYGRMGVGYAYPLFRRLIDYAL